ncbi:hypothetical protein ACFLQI_00555 [Candidatus Undinarchaeota archaeon]
MGDTEPEEYPEEMGGIDEDERPPTFDAAKKSLISSILNWKLLVIILAIFFIFIMIKFAPKVEDTTGFVDEQLNDTVSSEIAFVSKCQGSSWYSGGCNGLPPEDILSSAELNLNTTNEETIRRLCQCW